MKERFARFGIATKGFVYCLIGGLTAMAAFGMGGREAGSGGALEFLKNQPVSKVLLLATTIGLAGFVFWRSYQTFIDPENKGSDAQRFGRRFGYFSSGLFYAILAYEALMLVIGNSSGGGNGTKSLIRFLLESTYGQLLVAAMATVFLGKSIYQMYRAWSGKCKSKVDKANLSTGTRNFLIGSGKIGNTSRGLVIAIIAFLSYRAAYFSTTDQFGGTKVAFEFLENEMGSILFGYVALGLSDYGMFMLIKAFYREISMP